MTFTVSLVLFFKVVAFLFGLMYCALSAFFPINDAPTTLGHRLLWLVIAIAWGCFLFVPFSFKFVP